MVSTRFLPRTYCTGEALSPGMPTSANWLPCSSLNSSGLYMTGWPVPLDVSMSTALASSLVTGRGAGRWAGRSSGDRGRPFGRVISASPLEVGADPSHQVVDQAAAQRLDVEGGRRDGRRGNRPVGVGPHR